MKKVLIPITDLKRQYKLIEKELRRAEKQVFTSGIFILGEQLERFESEFADYLGVKYCIGVDSGTSALILALRALGIGKGDEVITPANSYIATSMSISHNQAVPVLVDCDEFYNIDISKIEEKISKRTKAILVVHLYGLPCQIEKIIMIAKKYKLFVVEDCAQAHGASFQGKKVGIFGDIGCYSFYPTKNLGCYGDGGAIVTSNRNIKNKIKLLRNYGQKKKYFHDILGFNNRLDELQAAYLRVKLKYLDEWNEKRRKIAKEYSRKLKDFVITPKELENAYHVYHQYVIRTKKRNELKSMLFGKRISTMIHYPKPIHLQTVYRNLGYRRGSFPNTEKYSGEILSLPIFPEMRDKEVEKVSAIINKIT